MTAAEMINQMIPPLKADDDAHKALVWIDEFYCPHLPVVRDRVFLGFISEQIILEGNNIDKKVADFQLIGSRCFVNHNSHLYDVLKTASENKLQLVAVLDEEQLYQGVITVQDALAFFAQSAAVQIAGGILVLYMNHADYSLAEISRLIEENRVKILSSIVKEDPNDPNKIRLTLKLNQTDLSRTVATLERFGYKVVGRYQETQPLGSEKERLEMLLRYLDI
jgi:signal-transduction protein with cAMP-binding, CBS, and nucleotidyltransferase domain